MGKHVNFKEWLKRRRLQEMAEVPRPGDEEWKLRWTEPPYAKPAQWKWTRFRKGEKPIAGFTPEDPRLYNPDATHSDVIRQQKIDDEKRAKEVAEKAAKQKTPVAAQGQANVSNKDLKDQGPAQGKFYYLAKVKNIEGLQEGEPVIVTQLNASTWTYENRKGENGTIDASLVKSKIESIKDASNKMVSGSNPKSLFDLFDQMFPAKDKNGIIEDEEGIQSTSKKQVGKPTPEQVKIPNAHMTVYNKQIEADFTSTDENIVIDAGAGTGKTTMLKHLSSFIKPGEKWLYIVFGKKNQIESSTAFPKGVDVLTTHAFLGKLLKQNGKEVGGEMQLPPEGQKWRKIWKIADNLIPLEWPKSDFNYRNRKTGEWTSPFHWKAKSFSTKLAELAKAYAVDPTNQNIATQKLQEIIVEHGFDTDLSTDKINQDRDFVPDMLEMSLELLKRTMPNGLRDKNDAMYNFRDQDDTLWFAALNADRLNWNPDRYDVVLMDEVQDFNQCQLIMVKKLQEAGCRVIGVGDPDQSMYGFRGANAEAFDNLKGVINSNKIHSLPINFRSDGNIIDWVTENTHVKKLQIAPHLKGKGRVYAEGGTHPPVGYEDFINSVSEEFGKDRKTSESTAIIARTNAPLAHTALYFLKNDVDFQILGKDLSKDLVDIIKKTTFSKPENFNIEDYADKLASYLQDVEDRWANKISKRDELKELKEFVSVMTSVLYFLAEKDYKESENSRSMETVKDFQIYIERKLGGLDPENEKDASILKSQDPKRKITLTTAHKAKGLEWERTFLLKPQEYDPQRPSIKTESQGKQEMNAWYVAATRARHTLMVSADDKP